MKLRVLLAALLLAVVLVPASVSANEAQWISGGNKSLRARQYDNAIRFYGAALKANRRSVAAAQGLGSSYYGKGDKSRALQYYNYALKLQPNNTKLKQMVQRLSQGRGSGARNGTNKNYAYGVHYLKKRNYTLAGRYLTTASQERPSDPNVWQSLGNAYYGLKKIEGAIQSWEKALTLRPNAQLRAYVDKLKANQVAIASGGDAAKKAQTQGQDLPPGVPDHDNMNYNPWVMGGVIATLGLVMLLVF